MIPTIRRALLVVMAVLVAAVAVACSDDDSNAADGPASTAAATAASGDADLSGVTLRVGVQKDGVRSVLEGSGQLDDVPYDIEWATFQFGPPIVEAAGADRIDVGWVGSVPPINGAAVGADFRVVAAFVERDRQENFILVPGDSDIQEVADLAGKSVAVPKASSAHGLLLGALVRNGVDPKDVEFNFLAPADALAAFQSGRVDALTVWDPFATQVIETTGAREIAGGEPDEHGQQFEIASAKALADPARRAAVADFVQRLAKAFAWARENPDAWAAAWTKESKLPIETTSIVVRQKALDVVPVSDEHIAWEQTLADLLFEQGVIEKEVDFRSIVDQGVYTAVPEEAASPATTTAP